MATRKVKTKSFKSTSTRPGKGSRLSDNDSRYTYPQKRFVGKLENPVSDTKKMDKKYGKKKK